jgi:antitoxin VapB
VRQWEALHAQAALCEKLSILWSLAVMTELTIKHDRVVGWLNEHGLDGVVLTRRCNFSWYTGGTHNHVGEAADVGASSLVVTRDGAVVVANNIEATRLGLEDLPAAIPVLEFSHWDDAARVKAFAEAMGAGKFATDCGADGLNLPPAGGTFNRLRWQLTAQEIERYRAVGKDVAAAVEAAARQVEPGMSENEMAGRVGLELRKRDCMAWVLLVAADERIVQFRHPLPTSARVAKYAMLATCAERGGLIAAVSRLVALGPISADLARRHQAVATVDAAMILATVPGNTQGQILQAAIDAYAQTGFADEWLHHHQGGPTGYLPREGKAMPGSTEPALESQAFAWNPTIAGTKSEDTILCCAEGREVLTATGDWPMLEIEWQGKVLRRPAILVKD